MATVTHIGEQDYRELALNDADHLVIPVAYQQLLDPRAFGTYAEPLPIVTEVWSPSTGDYDIAAKLPLYRERGDLEIWFIHPYERTLNIWRKQPDASCTEETVKGGGVAISSLPGVTIDFDELLGE